MRIIFKTPLYNDYIPLYPASPVVRHNRDLEFFPGVSLIYFLLPIASLFMLLPSFPRSRVIQTAGVPFLEGLLLQERLSALEEPKRDRRARLGKVLYRVAASQSAANHLKT
jgi:hypothetical protein